MQGKLYLVPTPIGNLEDITLRALKVLQEADYILAEDTRHSKKLLQHFEIETPQIPFHQHNEHKKLKEILGMLEAGKNLALVTDAGTPGISDPGFLLARACAEKGQNYEVLPGATAFIPALIKSALPNHHFVFEGFIPVKKGRQTTLKRLSEEYRTMVFYESPHKLLTTLKNFLEYFGDRQASVSRELTKKFEETINAPLSMILEHFEDQKPKGEFVICVEGKKK